MVRDTFRSDKSNARLKRCCATVLLTLSCLMYLWLLKPRQHNCRHHGTHHDIGLLDVFGIGYLCRVMLFMNFFWSRPPSWGEVFQVFCLIIPGTLISFALKRDESGHYTLEVDRAPGPCGPAHFAGSVLYNTGSMLSTWSEWERFKFKQHFKNKGRLMTTGLWSLSMHVNYLGEAMLFSGWALATQTRQNIWVPGVMVVAFVFWHIPGLDEYLAAKYPKEFPAWAASTSKFVPGIY